MSDVDGIAVTVLGRAAAAGRCDARLDYLLELLSDPLVAQPTLQGQLRATGGGLSRGTRRPSGSTVCARHSGPPGSPPSTSSSGTTPNHLPDGRNRLTWWSTVRRRRRRRTRPSRPSPNTGKVLSCWRGRNTWRPDSTRGWPRPKPPALDRCRGPGSRRTDLPPGAERRSQSSGTPAAGARPRGDPSLAGAGSDLATPPRPYPRAAGRALPRTDRFGGCAIAG